ncbi:PREDICTED: uncharacterized protein LOC109590400 [Amphimedon queenslandica]|uniref:Retrotransposon gag domain-containing protein n=1 Tax=Amphimedon queenslandica TaxID=400682 RepID=A0AAN0JXQ2_AMPQE|nr:PREDICTED: uncharacterized protein LOC109590400 [Amphimedon queenslandica]|eukprot:XP_019861885.1 PREDICTED: uncharacterized protein LOC109590400 [Amphimedon queenslandica]
MAAKPIILPDAYSGETNWEQWLLHFNDCADVNSWDAANKLKFLRVRLTGRAQTVFHRLSDTDKASFDDAVLALEAHFEPKGKRELYLADFSTRTKRLTETWVEYADELRGLVEKAYPDLSAAAHEQLALTQLFNSITDPQVVLAVKQKNPKSLSEAVTATLQIECILTSTRVASTSSPKDEPVSLPAHSVSQDDRLLELIAKLSDKIDNMATQTRQPRYNNRPRPAQQRPVSGLPDSSQTPRRPVVCFRSTTLCAVLNDTVRIPPYSELETLAFVNDFACESGIWLVEDNLSTSKRLNSTVARAIVTPNNHIVVRLINLANTPATIYKGTRVTSDNHSLIT